MNQQEMLSQDTIRTARIVAAYLARLGYKQTSHKYRLVATVDVSNEDLRLFFIEDNFGDANSSVPSLSLEEQRDFYRRVYASHWEVSEPVMRELRNMGAVAR